MPESIKSFQPFAQAIPQTASVKTAPYAASPSKLEETCRDFESVFIHYMLQQMRRTVPRSDLFNGGRAEEMVTTLMDTELSKSIAQQRSLGLASILYRQLNSSESKPSDE
jgi:peptidoglycan hydrolase FlgJ